ncbi:coiled-coil alpha-helical rod protein 1 isoform X2 [Pangasianodon hypophthalmus]|uniref:coiled-coil alpha-helical rod protein 1 isoform X2 n=1 Tax=Pangasianodon hypophthalmus TaxID=310915 RepID=UPI002307E23B|nr:coiled-coil alpha-helical rod protein 1 isoform X2 [Pangasianodon hypophthalmus]
MEKRNVEKLNSPSDFMTTHLSGVTRASSPLALLTPSHFTVTSTVTSTPTFSSVTPVCPAPSLPPRGADPWTLLTHTHQEVPQLHTHHTHSSHTPLREEMEELRRKVERLKEELRERDSIISRHCIERNDSCAKLKQSTQKFAELQTECVLQREQWDRQLHNSKEETHSLQKDTQEQMQQMCERHAAELSALTHTTSELQNTLHTLTQEVTSLRHQVKEVTSERDVLKEQLSALSSEKAEQAETLHKLRSYIGTHTGGEEQHTLIERLQKEKEALCSSVELLNVRVKSANEILTLQERELEEQCDPLHKDRSVRLLSLWREKVFMLLVQLRSKDSQLHAENTQLHHTVSDLQQEVQKLQSQIALLQHNLQDRTAQLQLHNIHAQELQQQLCSVVEENERLKKHKESSEKSTAHITDTVRRMSVCVGEWESQIEAAQCRMSALTQRLNFANTRLHTVHGLLMRREALWKVQQATKPAEPTASDSCIERLQSQVALLSSERDTLTQELKRTPQLIHNALRDLQLQLDRSREELAACELRCVEAHTHCEEQERTVVELRAEAHHTQTVLQEKLSEVESVCATQLREMESQLNTARREHTKAVVALRQVERAAERERQQERAAERARSELTQTHITQLHTQLKEKDRDRNILLAVVQQQGLMSEYKKMRRAAIHTSTALTDEQQQHKQQHKQQQQTGDTEQQEGSVLSVLCELRSLSSALIHSTDEEDDDDEQEQGDHTHTHTHRNTETLNTHSHDQ